MREKTGALIQFLAVIAAFILILWGIVGAYAAYFASEDLATSDIIYNTVFHLVGAAIGAGIGIGGVIIGNLLKR